MTIEEIRTYIYENTGMMPTDDDLVELATIIDKEALGDLSDLGVLLCYQVMKSLKAGQ